MTQTMRVFAESELEVNTILSERVLIPISCDHCQQETDVSLETLKSSSTVMCEHCYQVRAFSPAELQVLRNLLNRAGYRVTA